MITLKSHAKINVTLDIKGRREDGYHLLQHRYADCFAV